jgi:hypothetical protein
MWDQTSKGILLRQQQKANNKFSDRREFGEMDGPNRKH